METTGNVGGTTWVGELEKCRCGDTWRLEYRVTEGGEGEGCHILHLLACV